MWKGRETWVRSAWRRVRRDLNSAYKYPKGRYEVLGASFLSTVPSDRTRGHEHKLDHQNFHMNMRKTFFTVSVTALAQVVQRSCGVSFSGDIQNPAGCFLVLQGTCFNRGLDLMTSRGPFQTLWFCDSETRYRIFEFFFYDHFMTIVISINFFSLGSSEPFQRNFHYSQSF